VDVIWATSWWFGKNWPLLRRAAQPRIWYNSNPPTECTVESRAHSLDATTITVYPLHPRDWHRSRKPRASPHMSRFTITFTRIGNCPTTTCILGWGLLSVAQRREPLTLRCGWPGRSTPCFLIRRTVCGWYYIATASATGSRMDVRRAPQSRGTTFTRRLFTAHGGLNGPSWSNPSFLSFGRMIKPLHRAPTFEKERPEKGLSHTSRPSRRNAARVDGRISPTNIRR